MIYDLLENLNKYLPFFPELQSLGKISLTFLSGLDLGKHIINENVYINIDEYYGKNQSDCLYEGHRSHIDLQLVLFGEELVFLGSNPTNIGEYNSSSDIFFCEASKKSEVLLQRGYFVILNENELHMPSIKISDGIIKKVVIKIKRYR